MRSPSPVAAADARRSLSRPETTGETPTRASPGRRAAAPMAACTQPARVSAEELREVEKRLARIVGPIAGDPGCPRCAGCRRLRRARAPGRRARSTRPKIGGGFSSPDRERRHRNGKRRSSGAGCSSRARWTAADRHRRDGAPPPARRRPATASRAHARALRPSTPALSRYAPADRDRPRRRRRPPGRRSGAGRRSRASSYLCRSSWRTTSVTFPRALPNFMRSCSECRRNGCSFCRAMRPRSTD